MVHVNDVGSANFYPIISQNMLAPETKSTFGKVHVNDVGPANFLPKICQNMLAPTKCLISARSMQTMLAQPTFSP